AADADRFPPNTVDDLDGIGLQGEDWWVNLRKSNTEPLVRLNVEAADHGQMEELVRRVGDFATAHACVPDPRGQARRAGNRPEHVPPVRPIEAPCSIPATSRS